MKTLGMKPLRLLFGLVSVLGAVVLACGGSDDEVSSGSSDAGTATVSDAGPRGVEPAGQACTGATQCYPALDGGSVTGTVTCLDRVPNGYCTHTCTKDSDCCATPGECRTGVKQVCAPYTNDSSTKYCFLSCEAADIATGIAANADAGYYDGGATEAGAADTAYCQSYAASSASCRSTGGGKENRKVCVPQQ